MIEKYLFQHEQAEIQWDSFHTVGLKPLPQNLIRPFMSNILSKHIKCILDTEKIQEN